jgi:hypothetical protein
MFSCTSGCFERALIDGPLDNGLREKIYSKAIVAIAAIMNMMDNKFASFGRSDSDILFPPLSSIKELELPN